MSNSPENGVSTETGAWQFDDQTLAGMRDYWDVYDRHYDEIRLVVLAELAADQEVGRIIRATPPDVLEERGRESRELMRRAIEHGEWDTYTESLKAQGKIYAQAGLSFGAWFRIVSAFRPHLVRHLLATFGTDTRRLVRAIDGMDRVLDIALSSVGEAYLEVKEDIIALQREAVGERRARGRFRVILDSLAEGVVTTDPYGNVITANPAMVRLSGIPEEEAVGQRYPDIYPLEHGGRRLVWEERFLYKAIEERRQIRSEGTEVVFVRQDDTRVPVSITAAPLIDDDGRLVGGVTVWRELPPNRG